MSARRQNKQEAAEEATIPIPAVPPGIKLKISGVLCQLPPKNQTPDPQHGGRLCRTTAGALACACFARASLLRLRVGGFKGLRDDSPRALAPSVCPVLVYLSPSHCEPKAAETASAQGRYAKKRPTSLQNKPTSLQNKLEFREKIRTNINAHLSALQGDGSCLFVFPRPRVWARVRWWTRSAHPSPTSSL